MKKLTTLLLLAALACLTMFALSACGQQASDSSSAAGTESSEASMQAEAAPFATLGDVFAEDTDGMSSTFDEQRYVCAFNWGGSWWRVEAALEDGMFDKLNEVWTEDQGKVEEILSPLAVTKADAMSPLDVDSLEAYAGKTGADLAADGFEFGVGTLVVNGDETDCLAAKDGFDYLVTFSGKVADEDTDDPAGAVAGLTVSTVGVQGVSWSVLEG